MHHEVSYAGAATRSPVLMKPSPAAQMAVAPSVGERMKRMGRNPSTGEETKIAVKLGIAKTATDAIGTAKGINVNPDITCMQ